MGFLTIFSREKICEGKKTTGGCILTIKPLLDSLPEIKFAVFSDKRFYSKRYMEFVDFLPQEFRIVGNPKGQNCFEYSLDIKSKKIDRFEFVDELHKRNYKIESDKPRFGDIIAYYDFDYEFVGYKHSAIYVGDDRVRSRWGRNSPVIEHPLEEVLPTYMGEIGGYTLYRR